MNELTPNFDVEASIQFLMFWMAVTGVGHVTLVAIIPDGDTRCKTFTVSMMDEARDWIAIQQRSSRNVYFQPNETFPECAKKPSKTEMMAIRCRASDIDPADDVPLADERTRLAALGAHLGWDPLFPPTVVIDSGAGVQPLWACAREVLSPQIIARVEGETKAIEAALGAGGTHDITRLLRLPGTLNFPNAVKLKKGRGISIARLIHTADNLYSAAELAGLATHLTHSLDGTGLVRPRPTRVDAQAVPGAPSSDRPTTFTLEMGALRDELLANGFEQISTPEDMQTIRPLLRARLEAAMGARPQLANRWAGMVDDLTEAGKDDTRSGLDMSLAAMLKSAGFSKLEVGLILAAYPHGKTNGEKWPSADKRVRHVIRCIFRSHEPPPPDNTPAAGTSAQLPAADLIAEFNERYIVVSEGGKVLVYEPDTDPKLRRHYYKRLDFSDFKKMWMNRNVRVGKNKEGNPIYKTAADFWLASPNRRQYIRGVIFDPSGANDDPQKLNLWKGFGVTPRAGSWEKMKAHVRNILCVGNAAHYDYVLNWTARMIQFPAERGEVAIVMKGEEGSGKGIFANALRRIMGQHALKISNAKHLTGQFNAHLRDVVLLFADEAFYAGDKQHVGVLKSIITEDSLTIEGKYANAIETPNYLHVMMSSNEEWVVPAGLKARRFLVLSPSEAKLRVFPYFQAINDEMEAGGYEAMLHELQNRDLTGFNVRDVPDSAGLQEQKKLSLGTSDAWWLDVLHRGYVYKSKLGLEDHFGEWHEKVTTELLFASYTDFAKSRNERHPMSREALGTFMAKMGCKATRLRKAVVGEHITDHESPFGNTTRKAATIVKARAGGYHVSELAPARAAFTDSTKLPVNWSDDPEDANSDEG